jgi:hypothetical protein
MTQPAAPGAPDASPVLVGMDASADAPAADSAPAVADSARADVDAAFGDSGSNQDAAAADSGTADGEVVDAGVADASVADASVADVAVADAAVADGEVPDQGGDAGSCSANVPDGGACNTVVDVGGHVTPTCAAGVLPTGTGGTIAEGTYVLSAQTYYQSGPCQLDPLSVTFVASGDCIQLSATFYVGASSYPFRDSFIATVQANQVLRQLTCGGGSISCMATETVTFTATPSTLTLFEPATVCSPAVVEVYTRQ